MNAKLFLKNNASTFLTIIGSAGVIATAVTAVNATPKAVLLLEEAKKEKGEELTNLEKAKTVYKVYIPSMFLGVSTIGCMFGANVLNKRHQAALTSAYALLNSSYKEYKNKVKELFGDDVDDSVREEVAKDKYKEELTEGGKQLFYDDFSGRYFRSTIEDVQRAEYYLNRDLAMRDYVYLNEFYELLNIDPIDSGWTLGWSTVSCIEMYWQNWIDFNHKKVTMDDGLECCIITMFQEPIANFEDY